MKYTLELEYNPYEGQWYLWIVEVEGKFPISHIDAKHLSHRLVTRPPLTMEDQ